MHVVVEYSSNARRMIVELTYDYAQSMPKKWVRLKNRAGLGLNLGSNTIGMPFFLGVAYSPSLSGSIAHEMRNPLSQIHGAIHILKNHNKSNNDEFHTYYEDVIDVIKNSHQIIDITMDAINEKPIDKLNFQLVSALDICHEAVSSYAYKGAELRNKVSVVGSDFQILVDPVLVKYILYNLIGNALYYVQHMPKAEIVISTFLATRQIQVRDTGPGIAP